MTRANGWPSARLQRRTSSTRRTPSTLRTRAGAVTKPKSRTRRSDAMPASASCASIVPSRPERLAQRIGGDEPAEPLARVDQPFLVELLERAANRDAARGEGLRELGLARQQAAARELAGRDPPAELVGDLLVADATHLSYTCLHQVERTASTVTKGPARWPSPPSTPVELVEQVYARLPDRVALGRAALRAPAHARPRRSSSTTCATPERPGSSSGAAATPTSIPTASPCRTRLAQIGAAAVHDRRPARGRGAHDRALRSPHPGAGRGATSTSRSRSTPTREVYDFLRIGVAPSTGSASGSRARGSSTRSCSRTTRSPAG